MFDYLIVGAGLYGAVFAHDMTQKGKKCLVLEKKDHIGGTVYTKNIEGIQVHQYGAHIFHTYNKRIWEYINKFADFNHYRNCPLANYKGEIYNLPFNMNTFYQMWGESRPDRVLNIIKNQCNQVKGEPSNLEEQAIRLVGRDIYEKLIKGYTEKQWGRSCRDLPPEIIRRLPVRLTYDNNYFNDLYQGIPIGGYTSIIRKMLEGSEVKLNVDYLEDADKWNTVVRQVVYTGAIDTYFDYIFGHLEYRSLRFETEILDIPNYQGNAVINYTDSDTPYTRIIEHKHFNFGKQPSTVITREYSVECSAGKEAFYPINDEENNKRYQKYKTLADKQNKIIFGGRLGEYRYYDMDKVIETALERVNAIEAAATSKETN